MEWLVSIFSAGLSAGIAYGLLRGELKAIPKIVESKLKLYTQEELSSTADNIRKDIKENKKETDHRLNTVEKRVDSIEYDLGKK